jgi:hypothetical protein
MVQVVIMARDNDKPGNRELIEFLKPNFETFLRAGLRFTFKIVEDADIPKLVQQGLDKLPLAMIDKKHYMSSVEIKSVLLRYIATTKNKREKSVPEEEIREFYKSEMTFEAAERDADHEEKTDLMSKYQQEVQRRQETDSKAKKAAVQPKRKDNVEPIKAEREPTGADMNNKDDTLLMRMMETSDF